MDRKNMSGRGGESAVPEHGPQEGEGNRVLKLLRQESFKSERLDCKKCNVESAVHDATEQQFLVLLLGCHMR